MNEQSRPRLASPTVLQSLQESQADLEAGRIDDFDAYIDRLRRRISERVAAKRREEDGSHTDG